MALIAVSLLFTASCKTEEVFNIAGTWNGTQYWNEDGTTNGATYIFTGTELSGTVSMSVTWGGTATGPYTVTGLNITMPMTWDAGASHTANGTVSADFHTISGTFTQNNGWSGTWTATR